LEAIEGGAVVLGGLLLILRRTGGLPLVAVVLRRRRGATPTKRVPWNYEHEGGGGDPSAPFGLILK